MNDLTKRLAALTPEQREAFLVQMQKKRGQTLQQILPQPRETNVFPLSFSQQRLWFQDQLEPQSSLYTMPSVLRFQGSFSAKAFEKSLACVVQRHEILRTTFSVQDEQPVQIIASSLSLPMLLIDLTQSPSSKREQLVRQLIQQEVYLPFHLATGPLLRARILRLDEQDHILLFSMHHIVSDDWSIGILLQELTSLYQAELHGVQAQLPDLPVQYADYAFWQRQWLQGEVLQAQIDYWRQQLSGMSTVLPLPTDHPRPPIQTYVGDRRSLMLSSELHQALNNLSLHEGTTLFMVLLAAYQVLLMRYCGVHDIVVGSPIANRTRKEVAGLIGFFVNNLVLRTDLIGNPTFRQVLARVREVTLQAYAHQDLPFEKLVAELQPERDLSRPPLFQVTFLLQNISPSQVNRSDTSWKVVEREYTPALLDLSLKVSERSNGLQTILEYNTALFDETTIKRFLGHWKVLLEAIVQDRDQPIEGLPILTVAELEQQLAHWNAPIVSDQEGVLCLHQLFELQAERTPDAVALVFEQAILTYSELNRRSNQLASFLQRSGVGPDVCVGVLMHRSAELLIVLLAILKAGGAYIPLDPSSPGERLRWLFGEIQPSLILTQTALRETYDVLAAPFVCLDESWARITTEPGENLYVPVSPKNLAYMIYTSGSTGQPKGAMNTHEGISNRLLWMQRTYQLTPDDSVLQKTPFSFDVSVWELFWPLLCGARLVMARPGGQGDSGYLKALLQEQQISTLHFVPSMLQAFLLESELQECRSLRRVICSGEALTAELQERFFTTFPAPVQLHNLYGPTEAAVDVTYWNCQREQHTALVPIGRPIVNVQIYLLDEQMRLVPVGVAGEIYIGGLALARGYHRRTDLTAERFLPHFFSQKPGERLYKTGDLARYRADGAIEFIGRSDLQVKLHGFRIELGEIEAAIRTHSAVLETAVILYEQQESRKYLVAYSVVNSSTEILTANQLQQHLLGVLPGYMVPRHYVFLDALPLTSNGKVDRRALPVPELVQPDRESIADVPQSEQEALLAAIWSDVLGLPQVGISENFFELGGHSLLATQVISRILRTFQVELPVQTLFQFQTIATMLPQIEAAMQSRQQKVIPDLRPMSRSQDIPLSFAQERLWFLQQLDPLSGAYHIPLALRLVGPLSVEGLENSLQQLTARHESLRTTFAMHNGQAVQIIASSLPLPVPVIDVGRLALPDRDVQMRRLLQGVTQQPFDLACGPLLRLFLLRLEAQEQVLLMNIHHVVADGWSMGILVRELSVFYQAWMQDTPAALVPLPIQYADYALWQRQWLQGTALERQLTYWKQQLAGAPALLALPTDYPRPAAQTFAGASRVRLILPDLLHKLYLLSQQEDVTLFMTMLAAFQVLLMRYSGQHDIVVGAPVANRTRQEMEGLIGFFVNTLVLRGDLSGHLSFRRLLARVREMTLQAYAHQDLPFERLVDVLQVERSLSYAPLFQVLFVLQNTPKEQGELTNVRMESLGMESTVSKFDLIFSLTETEQGLYCVLEYNTSLFEAATILRMLDHWAVLLGAVVENPEWSIEEVPLLTQRELTLLLEEWNEKSSVVPQPVCLHELFEQQVERTPEAIAIVYEDQQLTYACLNAQANRLASELQARGIGPNVLVGVSLERSLDLPIALLGILKAGGAYVPLEPEYPTERLVFIVQESRLEIILTQQDLLPRIHELMEQVSVDLFCLDQAHATWKTQSIDQPPRVSFPENLVYITYTSGSTGRPKGVMMSHRALFNLVTWQEQDCPLLPGTSVLQFSALSFDISCQEFFSTWQRGGRVVELARDEMRRDPEALITLMVRELIERWFVPYVGLQNVAQWAVVQSVQDIKLRIIITAGEQLQITPDLLHWLEQIPGCRLYNQYGVTESHVVTSYALQGDPASWVQLPPIGRPIANTQIYLLDQFRQLVPPGVMGELYIGGENLALGYLKRPDVTAERFEPHPWSPIPGARLYRTGDLGRYQADGSIEYLGRIDHQVKLRGFRIEPGEIESLLRAHPAAQEAVVILQEDTEGIKFLVAYVVTSPGVESSREELRAWLAQQVPDYMVPGSVVFLDALPLTHNGKLDRHKLPVPEQHLLRNESMIGPRTPLEELLGMIWADLLHLPLSQLSIHDNFFALGGHSLLATQVISRLRQSAQVEVPVRRLFESPTIATLARQIEILRQGDTHLSAPPILPVTRGQEIPLSFAQERLWFLQQLDPRSTAYHIPIALRLHGFLSVEALEKSVQQLTRRHESLRTIFASHEGHAVQIILPALPIPVPVIDVGLLPQSERDVQARHLLRQAIHLPFDLAQGPLLRLHLLRLGEQDQVLLVNMHHIVTDGWSMGVLVRELSALYQAQVQGTSLALAPLPIQYADYALWQREWLQGAALEKQLGYWKQQLAGIPSVLALPTDHPRPAIQTFVGSHEGRLLSLELLKRLHQLSQQEGVTLFMLLLAAFQVLLMRYSGQTDIVLGTPIANRTNEEMEGLIGFFVNTLVLRGDLSGQPSFRELLGRVREVMLQAYAYQDLPFEQLVDALQVERSLSHLPLFQVLFVLQNTPEASLDLAGLLWEPIQMEQTTTKFDLSMILYERAQGLQVSIEYTTTLFDAATIARLLDHWEVLLAAIVEQPEESIALLPLLTPEEHQLLLQKNQADRRTDVLALSLSELFELQVERTPEAIAIVCQEQQLTYQSLDQRANQLAHWLSAQGVGPDVLVGVFMERSVEMLIALLGILKAGGAYLPLDPSYPQERINWITQHANPALLLTKAHLVKPEMAHSIRLFSLDSHWSIWTQESIEKPKRMSFPEHLAYVIYTSGSTGKPKGVAIEQRSTIELISWALQTFTQEELAGVIASTSISFDISIFELFVPLSCGGTVILVENVLHILDLPAIGRATLLNTVPSAATELVATGKLPASLETINLAGEPLPARLVQQLYQQTSVQQVYNLYGPTEDTTYSTYALMERGVREPGIGCPIANTQALILDEYQQLVPVGVAGELYLGGTGLARGYLYQGDLTAERFVPHPWSPVPGARLYRTGDLTRYRADGTIDYLGRLDQQVKLRGFRIELGEIEAVLQSHPTVQDVVVVLRETPPGEKSLVAYVVTRLEAEPTLEELRLWLAQQVPNYMLPASIILLDALPLTPNGKLDRQALPAPTATSVKTEAVIFPRNLVESVLASIWRELLNVDQVSITDNFFQMGGHSLLAVQLQNRIHRQFDVTLSLATLFQVPTIEQEAQLVLQQDPSAFFPVTPIVHIQPVGSKSPFFCVHPALGYVYSFLNLASQLRHDRPFYGIQAWGIDGEQEPLTTIQEMAAAYVNAIRAVQPEGPYFLGGYSFGGLVVFEMARLLEEQGAKVALLAIIDTAPLPQKNQTFKNKEEELAQEGYLQQIHALLEALREDGKEIAISYADLAHLHSDEQLDAFLQRLKEGNVVPQEMDLLFLRRLMRVYRANMEAHHSYQPQAYSGQVTLFYCEDATQVYASAWAAYTSAPVEVCTIPGTHETILQMPHVALLAEKLQMYLDNADGIAAV